MYLPILNSFFRIPHVLSLCPPSLFCPSLHACSFLYLSAPYSFLKHPIPSPLSSNPLSSKPLFLNPRLLVSVSGFSEISVITLFFPGNLSFQGRFLLLAGRYIPICIYDRVTKSPREYGDLEPLQACMHKLTCLTNPVLSALCPGLLSSHLPVLPGSPVSHAPCRRAGIIDCRLG